MIKIGVLGVGHLGRIHVKLLKSISDFQVVGFYDPNDENAQQVINEYGLKRFSSENELIENCDAVDIVTPTIHHYKCAQLALKKAKHIFIEKPITGTLEEAKKLIRLVSEADVKAQIGHVERFNPAFVAALPYCHNPMFIESHRLAQFNPRGTDVSVVLDLMIHDIDIILSVVNSQIKKISASGAAVVSDSPDIANARIEFHNGCVANLTASRISMKNMRKTRFFQRDAYISIDFLKKESSIIRLKSVDQDQDPYAITIDLGSEKGLKQIYFETPQAKPTNAIEEELKCFADAILNNKSTIVTVDDGYKSLKVANEIISKLQAASLMM
ncbi:MAG: Gfo/Idh/MocA family oxidoreductase [Bacteroidia bacterium]|nr:Gfo/Idh/MocA family oxidoreductase [Bacteroidia bacterium]MCZ2248321.1 Gfo/Idh/MocA family oxidoreductase [Bacteroidia bacterium]